MNQGLFRNLGLSVAWALALSGCGEDKPAKLARSPMTQEAAHRHNFSGAWIYAIGEVDTLGKSECDKALSLVEGEAKCVAKSCRYARDLSNDYLASCRAIHDSAQLSRAKALIPSFDTHVEEPGTECSSKAKGWVTQGCGTDGACEPAVHRWATTCGPVIGSPLTVLMLEHVIENSLREPHRVKLDTHGCDDFAKALRESEGCVMLRDCESALPKVEQYISRCAEGPRKHIPLRVALSIARVQLGAQQEHKPLPLPDQMSLLESVPDVPVLADNSGIVYKVCEQRVTNLNSYLDSRNKCENGEVLLLRAVTGKSGPELDLVRIMHESDSAYSAAFVHLLVNGEAAEREKRAIERLGDALKGESNANLASWLARLNQTYAGLPNSLKRSERVRKVFAEHEAEVSLRLGQLAELKLAMAKRHTSELESAAFVRRALKLPFSDVTRDGAVEWGAVCELGETTLGDEMKTSLLAYSEKFSKLKSGSARSRGNDSFSELASEANRQSKVCAAAKGRASQAVAGFDECTNGKKACDAEEFKNLQVQLTSARAEASNARAKEIVLKVSAGGDDRPSAACLSP